MTKAQILTEFGELVPESPASSAQQLIWANQGALDLVRRTKCLPTSTTGNLTAETQEYTLPTDLLVIDAEGGVQYKDSEGDWHKLKYITTNWLDRYIPNWRNETSGDPVSYYIKGTTLGFYPKPNSTRTNGYKVYYIQKPTAMSADGDDPLESQTHLEPYHQTIVLYMVWKAKVALGKFLQAREARAEYLRDVNKMIAEINPVSDDTEGFRPYHKPSTVSEPSDHPHWPLI